MLPFYVTVLQFYACKIFHGLSLNSLIVALEHFNKCSEKAKRLQLKRNRSIKDMFAKVPPKSKKKDASHLDTKSKETDIVIDSDIDLSDQKRDEV